MTTLGLRTKELPKDERMLLHLCDGLLVILAAIGAYVLLFVN